MGSFELGMSKDNVSFDFLKKQDKYYPGCVVLDMKKYGRYLDGTSTHGTS